MAQEKFTYWEIPSCITSEATTSGVKANSVEDDGLLAVDGWDGGSLRGSS